MSRQWIVNQQEDGVRSLELTKSASKDDIGDTDVLVKSEHELFNVHIHFLANLF